MTNQSFLGKEPVGKLLLKFSIPCIISLLIGALYNIADQIFIGNSQVGFLGNTATTVVYPITVIMLSLALFLGDGTAAYLSLSQGKGDNKNNHKAVGSMISALLLFSLIIMIVVYTGRKGILYAFGATDNSYQLAYDYTTILVAATPFYIIGIALSSVIRADGNPKISMISMLSGAVINVILDPILIKYMGIKGAALATIIGQILTFVISMTYILRSKTVGLKLKSFIPNLHILTFIFRLGISSFLTQISIVFMSIASNAMLKKYGLQSVYGGDIPVAVYGIVMKVYQIVISFVVGIAAGGQPILGYNYGAGNIKRVKKASKLIFGACLAISLLFFILFESIPGAIIKIFGSTEELYLEFGVKTLRIYLLLIVFTCIMKAGAIFLQSLNSPLKATLLSVVRDIACIIPLTIILPIFMGIDGCLWAAPISDLVGITVTVICLILEFVKLNKLEKMSKGA